MTAQVLFEITRTRRPGRSCRLESIVHFQHFRLGFGRLELQVDRTDLQPELQPFVSDFDQPPENFLVAEKASSHSFLFSALLPPQDRAKTRLLHGSLAVSINDEIYVCWRLTMMLYGDFLSTGVSSVVGACGDWSVQISASTRKRTLSSLSKKSSSPVSVVQTQTSSRPELCRDALALA